MSVPTRSSVPTLLCIGTSLSDPRPFDRLQRDRTIQRTLFALQGRLGVELARRNSPDLILLELDLLDGSGEEVLAELRRLPQLARTPIVVVAEPLAPDSLERLRSSGADAVLLSPVLADALLSTIRRLLPSPDSREPPEPGECVG